MSWTLIGTIPGIPTGSGGPNPTDAFGLRFGMNDINTVGSDATSFAFTFPDSIVGMADATSLALVLSDSNPTISDALLRIAIEIADTIAVQSEAIALALGLSDLTPAQSDALSMAFALSDANLSPTDAHQLAITFLTDLITAPTDSVMYQFNLLQADSIADMSEALSIRLIMAELASDAPTDLCSILGRFWLSGTTGTSGNTTNPANANSSNNGVLALAKTVVLGATTAALTSNVGAGIPNGTAFTTAIYRGWFHCQGATALSVMSVKLHSSSALFADIVMLTTTTEPNYLDGSFVFDLVAAGVNTLAKLQSCQVIHQVVDSVASAGGTFNVDAGCIELTNII